MLPCRIPYRSSGMVPDEVLIGYAHPLGNVHGQGLQIVAGAISLKKLSEAMRLGKLGEQIVLKSEKAFEHIRFVGAEPADAEAYYEKKALRDREARRAYRSTRQASNALDELYMIDIMREEIQNGDPRLR